MFSEGYLDKIYYRYWEADNPIANVLAIHGLGGHCLWFDNAAKIFNSNNINFISFDLPGFGQSKYKRGILNSYKEWINSTVLVCKKLEGNFKTKKPLFIIGHSMGALIATLVHDLLNIKGLVLTVPGYAGSPDSWPLSRIVSILYKAVVSPNESIIVPFGPEVLVKNKKMQEEIKRDKHRVINPSANLFLQVHLLSQAAKASTKKISAPLFMLMAGNDKVCSSEEMEKMFNKIKSPDKEKKIYDGAYHDLFLEDEMPQIMDDISGWIKKKVI